MLLFSCVLAVVCWLLYALTGIVLIDEVFNIVLSLTFLLLFCWMMFLYNFCFTASIAEDHVRYIRRK